jgi:enoyl-CoA hydratase
MNDGKLIYEQDGRVARITFDNRAAHNALTWTMWSELGRVCTEIARDPEIRVVAFRGAGGKSFISGTDIGGFLDFESGERGVAYENEMDSYIGAVEALPQPTVAIIDGWAVGGGLAISFASDFRIAASRAKFGSPLARTIGNCLSAKGYTRLVAHVGPTQAKRMLFLGDLIPAQELKDLGLVLDVVEPEELDARSEEIIQKLADMAPLTIRASKEAIRRVQYAGLPNIDDLISMVYGSEDFHNGVRNFMEKKPQAWVGK